MMVKQRQKKVDIIADFIPPVEIYGEDTGDLLVISWGGVFGSVKSGVKKAHEENLSVSHIHLRHLSATWCHSLYADQNHIQEK